MVDGCERWLMGRGRRKVNKEFSSGRVLFPGLETQALAGVVLL